MKTPLIRLTFRPKLLRRLLSQMLEDLWAGRSLTVAAEPIGTEEITFTPILMASVPETTIIIWLGEPPPTSG